MSAHKGTCSLLAQPNKGLQSGVLGRKHPYSWQHREVCLRGRCHLVNASWRAPSSSANNQYMRVQSGGRVGPPRVTSHHLECARTQKATGVQVRSHTNDVKKPRAWRNGAQREPHGSFQSRSRGTDMNLSHLMASDSRLSPVHSVAQRLAVLSKKQPDAIVKIWYF